MKTCFYVFVCCLVFIICFNICSKAQISINFSHQKDFQTESLDIEVNTTGLNFLSEYTFRGTNPATINGRLTSNPSSFILPDTNYICLLGFILVKLKKKTLSYI